MNVLLKWKIKDYHQMIEAGILNEQRVELLEGEIVEMSPESPLHSGTNQGIADYLREILRKKAQIREGHPITLSDSEPEPDIAIVKIKENNYCDCHPTPEDIFLLIEVSRKTLEKDKTQKKRIYAAAGIKEYWVVDLNATELIVWREPRGDDYRFKLTMNEGKIIPLAFADVELEVKKMLPK